MKKVNVIRTIQVTGSNQIAYTIVVNNIVFVHALTPQSTGDAKTLIKLTNGDVILSMLGLSTLQKMITEANEEE